MGGLCALGRLEVGRGHGDGGARGVIAEQS